MTDVITSTGSRPRISRDTQLRIDVVEEIDKMKVEWQAKIDSVDDEKLNLLVSLALSARPHHLLTLSLLRSGVLASRRHRGQVRRVGADVHDARCFGRCRFRG